MSDDDLSREHDIDAVFGALSDPMRRAILASLARSGGTSASGLAQTLPITRQGVAKHLTVLEGAGLVVRWRQGQEVRFRPNPNRIGRAMEWMASLATEWEDRLAALAHLATEPTHEPESDRSNADGQPAAPRRNREDNGGKR